jgi:hypothetical protein
MLGLVDDLEAQLCFHLLARMSPDERLDARVGVETPELLQILVAQSAQPQTRGQERER